MFSYEHHTLILLLPNAENRSPLQPRCTDGEIFREIFRRNEVSCKLQARSHSAEQGQMKQGSEVHTLSNVDYPYNVRHFRVSLPKERCREQAVCGRYHPTSRLCRTFRALRHLSHRSLPRLSSLHALSDCLFLS